MTKASNPIPLFLDGRGALLDAGYIYIGEANLDPETSPIDCYWDAALSIPAAQPFRTLGGAIANGSNQGLVYFAEDDFSIRVRDADGNLVTYVASSLDAATAPAYQPLDADLTAIAALTTTSFGRALLELTNTAALKAATGIPDCLPLTGGTMTGNIVRTGAGAFVYQADALMTGAREFGPDPSGTADATSQPGDKQYFY